ncbi:MAG: glycerol transport system ATP-binding protein [Yoonia sp.]|jgi:glycerol transport system ATP-binding protein
MSSATSGAFAGLGDGSYVAGFRPNHLKLEKQATDALEFTGNLTVTEITGSETFIHLKHHGENWVGLVHGVKNLEIGAELSVYLDQAHVYIFAQDGTSVAPASYAAAA